MYSRELYPSTAPDTKREASKVCDRVYKSSWFLPFIFRLSLVSSKSNKIKAHSSGGPKYNILHPSSWGLPLLILWDSWLHQSDVSQSVSSVAQSCPTLCGPMSRSTPGLPVHHQLPESTQTHVHQVGDAIQPCYPLSSPSPPALNLSQHQVFSNESALRVRWPKYWSFSFNISPSNEHPGLISFMMDWLDLLAIQGTLKSLLQHHSSKASIL